MTLFDQEIIKTKEILIWRDFLFLISIFSPILVAIAKSKIMSKEETNNFIIRNIK